MTILNLDNLLSTDDAYLPAIAYQRNAKHVIVLGRYTVFMYESHDYSRQDHERDLLVIVSDEQDRSLTQMFREVRAQHSAWRVRYALETLGIDYNRFYHSQCRFGSNLVDMRDQ